MKRLIAKWFMDSGCGYHLMPPGSRCWEHYFGSYEKMLRFADEMGWKLRRA